MKIRFNHPNSVILFDNDEIHKIKNELNIPTDIDNPFNYNHNMRRKGVNKRWGRHEYRIMSTYEDIIGSL